jgi:hypothetical protein
MPRVGFESTIPVFERAKTVHALNRATTVIGGVYTKDINLSAVLIELKGEIMGRLLNKILVGE